jgi:hypothetical protein
VIDPLQDRSRYMRNAQIVSLVAILSIAGLSVRAAAGASPEDARAQATLRRMTLDEKLALLRGKLPFRPPTDRLISPWVQDTSREFRA